MIETALLVLSLTATVAGLATKLKSFSKRSGDAKIEINADGQKIVLEGTNKADVEKIVRVLARMEADESKDSGSGNTKQP